MAEIDEKALDAFTAVMKRQDLETWNRFTDTELRQCLMAYEAAKASGHPKGVAGLDVAPLVAETMAKVANAAAHQPVECREEFEKDAVPYGYDLKRAGCHCCYYHSDATESRWLGWQAAWEAKCRK